MAREKLSKEEKAAQKARQEQIRHLWQSAGIKDIAGVESLIQEMKKVLIEDIYQAELDTHLGYGKNDERTEESENYRNETYHKFVKTKDGELERYYKNRGQNHRALRLRGEHTKHLRQYQGYLRF